MRLPRFLANILRAGDGLAIVATRNFDELGSILGKAFKMIEDEIAIIRALIPTKAEIWGMIRRHAAVYNVKDYGAKGDGTTVDTTAIQRAIDACAATVGLAGTDTGGGIVFFPPGRYLTGSLLVTTQFVSFLGCGNTATEIVSSGTGTSFVKFYGGAGVGTPLHLNCFIRDIKFIQGTDVAWTNFLHLENVSEVDIDNIWVETSANTCSYSVMMESALVVNMSKSIVRGALLDAVRMKKRSGVGDAYPNAIVIRETAIKSAARWGIHYTDGEGFLVNACDMSANGSANSINNGAIYINDAGNEVGAGLCAVISNTRFEATTGVQVRVGEHSFSPGGTKIENCSATGAYYGVYSDVTSPDIARVIVRDSAFAGSSQYDYYIGDAVNAEITNCRGITNRLAPSTIAIPTPANSSVTQTQASILAYIPQDFTNNSATPAVNVGGPIIKLANTNPTTITSMTGCKDGNTLTFFASNGNTTFKHRNSGTDIANEIDCPGGADYTLGTREIITFTMFGGHWYCTSLIGPGNKYKYVETTYTATITCTTSGTISLNSLRETLSYIRIGNQVTVLGRVDVASVSSPVGGVQISLPFAVAVGTYTKIATGQAMIENYPNTQCFWRASSGASVATLMYNNAGASTLANAADFAAGVEINITLTYFTE